MNEMTPHGAEHVHALRQALQTFDGQAEQAEAWGLQLARRLDAGAQLLAAGNGGSAAQAQHLTAELVGRYRHDRRPFPAVCLNAETSTLTAIANDYPATELFARQVEAHGRPGDVLVLLSTSGSSPNIVAAAERAVSLGVHVWAMTGTAPNALSRLANDTIAVPAPLTATVQELHLVLIHLLCASFDASLEHRGTLTTASLDGSPT